MFVCGHSFCRMDMEKLAQSTKFGCPDCNRVVDLNQYPDKFPSKNYGKGLTLC